MGCCCDCSKQIEFVKAELKVPMHCQACERTVVGILFRFEGVESVKSSFDTQKVVVTGRIDLPKLVKTIKRKTLKTAQVAEVITGAGHDAVVPPAGYAHACGCSLCVPSGRFCVPRCVYDNRVGVPCEVPNHEEDSSYSYCSIM